MKLNARKLRTWSPHLQTVAALPREVQKVVFQKHSTVMIFTGIHKQKIEQAYTKQHIKQPGVYNMWNGQTRNTNVINRCNKTGSTQLN